MASSEGGGNVEADMLLKKFQHDKFSGGIESNDLHKM